LAKGKELSVDDYTVKVDDKILTDFSPGDGTIDITLQQ
jgi:hypothetical protein